MIVKNFDIGWGQDWPMKKHEQDILQRRYNKLYTDNSRTVIINSVWYTDEYHQQVLQELRDLNPTHILVVAMLDPPIIKLDWFKEFGCEVIGVGFYPGSNVDYFAQFMHKFYQASDVDLLDTSKIDTAYMCLNRKPHHHRLRLYQGLSNANLLDNGFVTLGGNPPVRLLDCDVEGQQLAPNGNNTQYGIGNDIATLGNTEYWQRHFVNIVTETSWDIEPSNFLSEKTFKPIVGLRPFLLYAPNGGVECLRNRGFEPYINDFNDIVDIDLREPYNIVSFLQELCKQPKTYWQMKFNRLKEKLLFNQDRFNTYVRE